MPKSGESSNLLSSLDRERLDSLRDLFSSPRWEVFKEELTELRGAWLRRLCRAKEIGEVNRLQGGIEVLAAIIDGGMEGNALIELDKPEPALDYMGYDSDGAPNG